MFEVSFGVSNITYSIRDKSSDVSALKAEILHSEIVHIASVLYSAT